MFRRSWTPHLIIHTVTVAQAQPPHSSLKAGSGAVPGHLGFSVGLRALYFLLGASVSLSVQLEG